MQHDSSSQEAESFLGSSASMRATLVRVLS